MAKKASKPKPKTGRKADADDPHASLRASLLRLQDPEYVVQVIKQCQERGLIPKDAA